MPILALNCRLQVEQVSVKESTGDLLVLALRSLRRVSFSFTDSRFFIVNCSFADETLIAGFRDRSMILHTCLQAIMKLPHQSSNTTYSVGSFGEVDKRHDLHSVLGISFVKIMYIVPLSFLNPHWLSAVSHF